MYHLPLSLAEKEGNDRSPRLSGIGVVESRDRVIVRNVQVVEQALPTQPLARIHRKTATFASNKRSLTCGRVGRDRGSLVSGLVDSSESEWSRHSMSDPFGGAPERKSGSV